MKSNNLFVIGILWTVIAFSGCRHTSTTHDEIAEEKIAQLPYFNSPDFTPEWNKKVHKIPDFSFLNQNGKPVTNTTYTGKIYVADFFFTKCPGICPKLAKSMNILQDAYASDPDILLLSHTVMPGHDSIPVLAEYAKNNKVDSTKWNLVTGNKKAIYDIARAGYFADEDFIKTQDETSFIHTENFVLIGPEGYIRGVYNGTLPVDIQRLQRHISILKKEL